MHLVRAVLEKAGCCGMSVSDDRKTSVGAGLMIRLLSLAGESGCFQRSVRSYIIFIGLVVIFYNSQ